MVAVHNHEVAEAHKVDAAQPRNRLQDLPSRDEIAAHHLIDETRLVGGLIERAVYSEDERRRTAEVARQIVHAARGKSEDAGGVDSFMREYGLSSDEGVILMGIAESLLRIPDNETADDLIAEKLSGGAWESHLGHSPNALVNASSWGLMLTGRLVKLKSSDGPTPLQVLKRLVARSGEPVIRQAVRHAVKLLGDHFVAGRTIKEALHRARALEAKGYLFSYDMLGEAARTEADADIYYNRYMSAIEAIGAEAGAFDSEYPDALMQRPGLSVKLSALHPRFEPGKKDRLARELVPRVITLIRAAKDNGISVTIDTEEQDRLEPTLDVFASAFLDDELAHWHGLGIAVQAYGKRAIPTLRWLLRLSERVGKRIPIRLVKGAYWDSEIKWAQERGLADYPVFTRKLNTDVSYLACMRFLLSEPDAFYPQFATHNAHSIAAAYVAAGRARYEFQRLHGMGEALYEEVVGKDKLAATCRIYAPVGGHEDLLAYLVRRFLENGANASFVNRLADDDQPISELIADPVETAERLRAVEQPQDVELPRPRELFLPERRLSDGLALRQRYEREQLLTDIGEALREDFEVFPVVDGEEGSEETSRRLLLCPHDNRERIGSVYHSLPRDIERAVVSACAGAHSWDMTPVDQRATILEHAADLFERDRARLIAVAVREAGKTLETAHADVREAIDFLRYYAVEARKLLSEPVHLQSVTGETNTLSLRARGAFVCISPWNFPVAIFTGQIAAALATGNTVLAKPAEQTPIAAALVVNLLHEAGVPPEVLHFLPGGGDVGERLVQDPRIAGVVFTGSNETAWSIGRNLADRRAPIVPFIAETGGINAMIADSSALPEQVVRDCVRSAFDMSGQRCSAARIVFIQNDIAEKTIEMLAGAIRSLDVGDPIDIATDIGPVIDEAAQDRLDAHKLHMQVVGKEIADVPLPENCRVGTYVTPAAYELEQADALREEVFGPILHVVRYEQGALGRVIDTVNSFGYGLTLGLHSRIDAVADYVAEHARVGNMYVNRDQIGAAVGAQPFGGEGLSGTGPKAGGPNYLFRFVTERVRTTDITATGGNISLLKPAS